MTTDADRPGGAPGIERRLAELERRLADTQRLASLGSWEWEPASGALSWSAEVFHIYGLSPDTPPTAELLFGLTHPDDLPDFRAAVQGAVEEGRAYAIDVRILRPDGGVRVTQAHGEAVLDEAGRLLRVVGTVQDITDRVRTEQALRESEERSRVMLNALPDPLVIYDPRGLVTYLNPAFERTFGWSLAELSGRRIDFVPAEYRAQISEALQRVYGGEELLNFQTRRLTRDGRALDIQISASVYRNALGEHAGLIVILRDISELMRVQEELLTAQGALISELSTPLMPISDDILVMPLVGTIDSVRAQQITERLLTSVGERRARTAIIDITGVPVVDTQTANALLGAARAARLLGAGVVLTGIGPEVAQTLVGIGVSLDGLVTRGTLQSGIAYASGRERG